MAAGKPAGPEPMMMSLRTIWWTSLFMCPGILFFFAVAPVRERREAAAFDTVGLQGTRSCFWHHLRHCFLRWDQLTNQPLRERCANLRAHWRTLWFERRSRRSLHTGILCARRCRAEDLGRSVFELGCRLECRRRHGRSAAFGSL